MFYVKRLGKPLKTSAKGYDTKKVHEALSSIFYNKCYLCEEKITSRDIEHFLSQVNYSDKSTLWGNLYLAFPRCNRLNNKNYDDILDCTNQDHVVFNAIRHTIPINPTHKFIIEATDPNNILAKKRLSY